MAHRGKIVYSFMIDLTLINSVMNHFSVLYGILYLRIYWPNQENKISELAQRIEQELAKSHNLPPPTKNQNEKPQQKSVFSTSYSTICSCLTWDINCIIIANVHSKVAVTPEVKSQSFGNGVYSNSSSMTYRNPYSYTQQSSEIPAKDKDPSRRPTTVSIKSLNIIN